MLIYECNMNDLRFYSGFPCVWIPAHSSDPPTFEMANQDYSQLSDVNNYCVPLPNYLFVPT